MSESTASKDSFALFAEFMRWKESQESSRNSSVPSGGVGDSGTQVEVQSSSKDAVSNPKQMSTNTATGVGDASGQGDSPGSTPGHEPGHSETTDFTADDYLSRSKKYSTAKKKFRVSFLLPAGRFKKHSTSFAFQYRPCA